MKRIAFLISDQHLIPHGGIGQFAKGFTEMCALNGWVVDLILDRSPRNLFFEVSGLSIYPEKPHSNSDHTKTFAFSDSYNLERATNFRNAFMLALQKNLYDCVVVNTPEALLGIYGLNLWNSMPLVFYTHNENLVFKQDNFKGIFNDLYDPFFLQLMKCKGVIVGTQSETNKKELSSDGCQVEVLPMPMSERSLLEEYKEDKSGVLFIGRWEDRKDPQEFLRAIKETNLPAKVMTSASSVDRFKKELTAIGVEHDVRGGITGKEKSDFIRSAKLFYMPSKSECYPFAFFESIGHLKTFVLNGYSWSNNFKDLIFIRTDKKNIAEALVDDYTKDHSVVNNENLRLVKKLDADTWDRWKNFVENFKPSQSNSNAANVNKVDDKLYSDYVFELNRFASVEDVQSVLNNRHKFKILYSKSETWLSKTGKPIETKQALNLDDFF